MVSVTNLTLFRRVALLVRSVCFYGFPLYDLFLRLENSIGKTTFSIFLASVFACSRPLCSLILRMNCPEQRVFL